MKTVYKYPIRIDDHILVEMPKGAKVLHAAEQFGRLCLWAEIDTEEERVDERHFRIAGTGHNLETKTIKAETLEFVSTVVMHEGERVIHVYESRRDG